MGILVFTIDSILKSFVFLTQTKVKMGKYHFMNSKNRFFNVTFFASLFLFVCF